MKILLFDIETTPNLGYTWQKYDQNVLAFQREWQLLSFAYKWLGEKEVHCVANRSLTTKGDRTITKQLWKLFDEADILIAHNGDSFDVKKAKAKFIEHGLVPPSPSATIDTKKLAKNNFKFNSNSLNDLGKILGLGEKLSTGGFELWLGCMAGDEKAWAKMIRYNKQDVVLLEKVYLKLRGWARTSPIHAYVDGTDCPKCGSDRMKKRGFVYLTSGIYQAHQCKSCGGTSRSRKKLVFEDPSQLRGVA